MCGTTRTLWKKKRGRRGIRTDRRIAEKYITGERASSARISAKKNVSESCVQSRVARSRDALIRTVAWRSVPHGDLILIADAVVELIGESWVTVYLMLARSVTDDIAVILPPRIARGRETPRGWSDAIDAMEPSILCRIKAIVCDGHAGLTSQGLWRSWVVQRCHFHLIASIRARRATTPMARNQGEARVLIENARVILTSTNPRQVERSLSLVEEAGWQSSSRLVRKVVSGFVRNYLDYRSYLRYPELNLPSTSNSAECVASIIGDIKRRLRGFKTERSFESWVIAVLKLKGAVKCRKKPQN